MRTAVYALVALGLAAGCATNPKPGEPGYAYNLAGAYASTYTVEGTAYEGTTEFSTVPGGAVRGELSLERPARILGNITGTITGDSLSFSGTYAQEGGCDGTLSGAGRIAEGGAAVDGPVEVDDSCGGLLKGTFAFRRGP